MKSDDKILATVCEKFDFDNPPFDPIEFAQSIVKFIYENNGIVVAANQVGIPYSIFAMRGHPQNFVCFNPKIVQPSEEEIILEETSMSNPGFIVKVKRPRHVRVRFQTPNGETKTETFSGFTARAFQQAIDYLNGVKFYENANPYHIEQAKKKAKKK